MQRKLAERTGDTGVPVAELHPRSASRSMAYGLLGFLLGAVFWHFVGFWDFIGHIMFKGTVVTEQELAGTLQPIKLRERVSGVDSMAIMLSAQACTSLQLDRTSGETRSEPCVTETASVRSLKPARRQDLWVVGGLKRQDVPLRGWSAIVVDASD